MFTKAWLSLSFPCCIWPVVLLLWDGVIPPRWHQDPLPAAQGGEKPRMGVLSISSLWERCRNSAANLRWVRGQKRWILVRKLTCKGFSGELKRNWDPRGESWSQWRESLFLQHRNVLLLQDVVEWFSLNYQKKSVQFSSTSASVDVVFNIFQDYHLLISATYSFVFCLCKSSYCFFSFLLPCNLRSPFHLLSLPDVWGCCPSQHCQPAHSCTDSGAEPFH